jgi:glyoxylase-like metal-dependent hydrolase (beta-lactamase superfamily II)
VLPDIGEGLDRLIIQYGSSRLAAFHRAFYDEPGLAAAPPDVDPASLPPCIAACLVTPNDLLLRPEHVQYLTRALLARGWRPGQIAALVRSHYEADHDWGARWMRMHPQTRAEFDVRVFAGLLATGLDRMVDYNCVSAQEKGVCPGTGCAYDLRVDRDRLLSRGRL